MGKAISAKNFCSIYFYLKTADALIILAARSNPPNFILILHTEP